MQRLWLRLGNLGMMLVLVIGCKSSQPELKPPTQPEEYNPPPAEMVSRGYPKEAMKKDDLLRAQRDSAAGIGKNGFGPGGMGAGGMSSGMNGGGMR